MKKIRLIIQREYLTRVRKKSFVIMTFLGPILMASVWIVPLLLATRSEGVKTIEVLDETGLFYEQFKETADTKFLYIIDDLQTAKKSWQKVKILPFFIYPNRHIPPQMPSTFIHTRNPG